jgi:hypothetical protein
MVLQCETIATGAPKTCPVCKVALNLKVLMSGAGYYIGTECNCGPYSRESLLYYMSREDAQRALDNNDWNRR